MQVVIDGVEYAPISPAATGKSLLAALDFRIQESDAGDNITVRDYLRILLEQLWAKQEGFSGKRPFGNSGWDNELYRPLIAGGFISGRLDEDGYISEVGDGAHEYVESLILAAFNPQKEPA